MKVSTDLLKAIAFGVALGATTTSCDVMFASASDLVEETIELQNETFIGTCGNSSAVLNRRGGIGYDDCPACGMG